MNLHPSIRQQIEAEVERLLSLLDILDGDTDLEPYLTGDSDGMDDREGDDADGPEEDSGESGIADMDGYMEQCPKFFEHGDARIE